MSVSKTYLLVVTTSITASLSLASTARGDEPQASLVASSGAGPAVAADPNLDRGFVLPTAMTQPAGTITYNNYELLLHGLTYGITDKLQVSATVLSPITKDMPFFGMASLKGRVLSTSRFNLALQGSVGTGVALGDQEGSALILGSGALASFCLREDCSSLLSTSATYTFANASGADEGGHLILYGASIVHRVGNHVKLLGEVVSGSTRTSNEDADNFPGFAANYGVRFFTGNIAGDIGFIRPIGNDDTDTDDFLLGLPFVNVSYRWQ